MPKRKRSRSKDSDYDSIFRKVKKLKRKLKKRRERSLSVRSSSSQSDYKSDYPDEHINDQMINLDDDINDEVNPTRHETTPVPVTPPSVPSPLKTATDALSSASVILPETQAPNSVVILDPEILDLLGEDPANKKSHGVSLHQDIAPRWTYILTNGLTKDTQAELLKQYLLPDNCPHMSAPKLNPEIVAALSELNVKQDQYSQGKQNQLGSGLAAIGQVLNWALTSKNIVPPSIIKALSDAGRLICDNFHRESLSRRYTILNTLNKNIKDTIKNTKIDENLFGSNLSEHLKSSKAITKTASEMKPARTRAPPVAQQQRTATLNSRGNPRASAAEPRTAPASRRPPPPPPPPQQYRRQPAPRGRQRAAGYSKQQMKR